MPRIFFDAQRCAGHALCNAIAPEVYQLDDDGYCHNVPTTIKDSLRDAAVAGAQACPEGVLRVIDDSDA